METARKGRITAEMEAVARDERKDVEEIRQGIASGEIVIPVNRSHRNVKPVGIGKGLRTKVNANLGTSTACDDPELELLKAKTAVDAGADTLMDLSTGSDIPGMRRALLKRFPIILGTVPIYQSAVYAIRKKGALSRMTVDDLFGTIEQQAQEGVDFFTVHCGVTQQSVGRLKQQGRLMDIVSRGGSFLAAWMEANKAENPLYEYFDRLLDIVRKHDVTLSLGDGLRPGSLQDATDRGQIEELVILGELTQRAWKSGVQVMIEGPGHVPLDQIETNIKIQKRLCNNAPFYVLGPLVTDVASGYDHIASAIGGALAASFGADFLCYVTPGEHLKLPDAEDVRQGVIACRVAAHAGDIAKGIPGAMDWDIAISTARKALDWKKQIALSIDPVNAEKILKDGQPESGEECTMCGEYCAIKLMKEALKQNSHTAAACRVKS